jgi:hypothetical protein
MSWVIAGELREETIDGQFNIYKPSRRPIFTGRRVFHQVRSVGRTWVLSLRGPWSKTWHEYHPNTGATITLTHGRKPADAHLGAKEAA